MRSTWSPAARLPGPEGAEALPVPANHGLGANEVERLSPPSPMVGEPHPEEAIEAPELRSLRSAAEQGKLLPERQVLEREIRAGSERRAQGAQQSEYEGHWHHRSHARCPSSSLGREFWQTTPTRPFSPRGSARRFRLGLSRVVEAFSLAAPRRRAGAAQLAGHQGEVELLGREVRADPLLHLRVALVR